MSTLTIKEIAKLADVSPATVSRVLNGHPNVRAAVRSRVMQIVREQNYTPNAAARTLSSRRAGVICLLLLSDNPTEDALSSPFFATLVQSVVAHCNHHGIYTVLSLIKSPNERDFYKAGFWSQQFDGILVHATSVDDPMLPLLAEGDLPVVLLDRHPQLSTVSWVHLDNIDGAYQAVQHLIDLGHCRIATLTGPLNRANALDRLAGYRQALLGAGLPIDDALIVEGQYRAHSSFITDVIKTWFALPQPPTAIFAANDDMAFAVISALQMLGLQVPNDVAVVGFDDFVPSPFPNLELTTVRSPIRELCATAVDVMVSQINGDQVAPVFCSLPVTLVLRNSCGASEVGFALQNPSLPSDVLTV